MTPSDFELAQQLAQQPGIWRAGMLGASGIRYDAVDEQGRPYRIEAWRSELPSDASIVHVYGPRADAPDLSDGPTRGALLDVARELWAMPSLCVLCTVDGLWYPYAMGGAGDRENDRLYSIKAPSEGAAVAATVLAAVRHRTGSVDRRSHA